MTKIYFLTKNYNGGAKNIYKYYKLVRDNSIHRNQDGSGGQKEKFKNGVTHIIHGQKLANKGISQVNQGEQQIDQGEQQIDQDERGEQQVNQGEQRVDRGANDFARGIQEVSQGQQEINNGIADSLQDSQPDLPLYTITAGTELFFRDTERATTELKNSLTLTDKIKFSDNLNNIGNCTSDFSNHSTTYIHKFNVEKDITHIEIIDQGDFTSDFSKIYDPRRPRNGFCVEDKNNNSHIFVFLIDKIRSSLKYIDTISCIGLNTFGRWEMSGNVYSKNPNDPSLSLGNDQ